jgi:hypothetical protein
MVDGPLHGANSSPSLSRHAQNGHINSFLRNICIFRRYQFHWTTRPRAKNPPWKHRSAPRCTGCRTSPDGSRELVKVVILSLTKVDVTGDMHSDSARGTPTVPPSAICE